MKQIGYMVGLGMGLMLATSVSAEKATSEIYSEELIERGKYLTHSVAMCVVCHSPRQEDGTLVPGREFRGGAIPVPAPFWQTEWAITPPDLVALAKLQPGRIVSVLMTGQRPDGTSPSPPMPPFRFSAEDAQAVAAYLQTLELDTKR